MSELDVIDYDILARYWTPEVWFSRVGTDAERNSRERTPDGGPRGVVVSGGASTQADEVCSG